jgi:dTDP-L-rhamnose 4-epimerase
VLAGSMVVYGEGRHTCAEHGVQPAPSRRREDLEAGRFEPACPRCGEPMAPGLVPEETAPDPRNVYAVTKLAQELLAGVWARETGGKLTTLRYHNVYGPGLPRNTPYAGVAAIFRSALARGEAPRVFEDGGQRRDFVHVRDVAAANVLALEAQGATPVDAAGVVTYNVASGTQRTVLDLAAALAGAVDGPAPVVTGEFRLGDVRHVTADTARIRAELGWKPTVDFAAGVAELVDG